MRFNNHNFRLLRRMLTLGLSSVFAVFAGFNAAKADTPAGTHITICHRTGSASNPYISISPDVEGVINGHLDHEQTGNGLGGDIIPLFTFNGVSFSKNLGTDFGNGITGARILANGCFIPRVTKPTPTPPAPPTSPSPTPVPEPMTILLFGTGLASIGMAARRRFGKKDKGENGDEN